MLAAVFLRFSRKTCNLPQLCALRFGNASIFGVCAFLGTWVPLQGTSLHDPTRRDHGWMHDQLKIKNICKISARRFLENKNFREMVFKNIGFQIWILEKSDQQKTLKHKFCFGRCIQPWSCCVGSAGDPASSSYQSIILILKLGTHLNDFLGKGLRSPHPAWRRGVGMKPAPSLPSAVLGNQTLSPPPSSCAWFRCVLRDVRKSGAGWWGTRGWGSGGRGSRT